MDILKEEQLRRLRVIADERWIEWSNPYTTLQSFKRIVADIESSYELACAVVVLSWSENSFLFPVVLNSPFCDKGIKLLIYWISAPWYLYRLLEKNAKLNDDQQMRLSILRRIESDFVVGSGHESVIAVDPNGIFGKPIRDDYPTSPGMKFIPDYMRISTTGLKLDPVVIRELVSGG